jgi:hypothetical protein
MGGTMPMTRKLQILVIGEEVKEKRQRPLSSNTMLQDILPPN